MPRETKAYLCVFRCGRRSTLKRKAVEEHESRCAMNPARRSCKTCAHDVRGGRDEGIYCAIEAKPERARRPLDDFDSPVTLMYDCPSWVPRAPGVQE